MRRHLRLTAALVATMATLAVASAASADASTKRTQRTTTTTAPTGITASGGALYLNGKPTFFDGINSYQATTDWNINYGCGSPVASLDSLFSNVPTGSLVRTWAFQALGFNKFTHQIDFTAIDRVVATAQAHGDYLILALSDQAGACDDGHWHDQAWYDGGYQSTYNDNGRGLSLSMSYLNWVKTVARRYASNPTVAVYEPVNEPEASNCNPGYTGGGCYAQHTCAIGGTTSLRNFFDTIGSTIKSLAPRALVSTGTLGTNQCGVAGTGFATINASPWVDIATYHDYGAPTVALPASLATRVGQAAALGKAILVEESGINAAAAVPGCTSLSDRASQFNAKISAAQTAGADGYLPWGWASSPSTSCALGLAAKDPLLSSWLAAAA